MASLLRALRCKFCARAEEAIRLASAAQFRAQANDAALLESDRLQDRFRAAGALWEVEAARAVGELIPLAEAGSIWAMNYLGCAYRDGHGASVDPAKAELWFRRAFEAGSDNGLIFLASFYAGAGRHAEASEIFRVGTAKNLAAAEWRLAHVVLGGPKTAESLAEARRLLESAATRGYLSANRTLVGLLLAGRFGIRGRIEGAKLSLDLAASVSAWERGKREATAGLPVKSVRDAQSIAT